MNTPFKRPFNPNYRPGGAGGGRPGNRGGGGRYGSYSSDTHRINFRINAREVRVVTDDGEQLGIMQTRQALELAESRGLDLVEVSPNAQPPVCKVMDYGKFKYKEQKRETEAKKKRVEIKLKELRVKYRTDKGDLDTKIKHAREFIAEGDKVKFSMQFKGREAMYLNLGVEKFKEIQKLLEDVAVVDEKSPASGRKIHIVFAPIKKAVAQTGGGAQAAVGQSPATGTQKQPAATAATTQPAGTQTTGTQGNKPLQVSTARLRPVTVVRKDTH